MMYLGVHQPQSAVFRLIFIDDTGFPKKGGTRLGAPANIAANWVSEITVKWL
jgi:hypothetical protein